MGLAVDSAGNLFIADATDACIREVNAVTGIITTVAGIGNSPGSSGDGGQATAAQFLWPNGIAVDSAGDLFISDSGNNRVREVNAATGVITTIAGNGTAGYAGDGGPATAAELNSPYELALDAAGNLFIPETSNACVRELNLSTGIISTVAGGGSGEGNSASDASLSFPTSVAVDSAGNLFIADRFAGAIREVSAASPQVTVSLQSPTVTVRDAGGIFNGMPFSATATVAGANGAAGASLEGVTPTLTYYTGRQVSGTGSVTAPTAAGTYTVVASFAGSADYAAAQSAPVSFQITQATPTITWPAPAAITYGTKLGSTQLDAAASWTVGGTSGSVPGTFTYTPTAGTMLSAGNNHTLAVTFTPTDTTDYATATQTTTINVNRANPAISWPAPAAITYGTKLGSTQLDAAASWTVGGTSGSVPGTFTYTPAAGTVLSAGNNRTLAVTFTPTDTTDYATATRSTEITVVGPVSLATSTITLPPSQIAAHGVATVTLTARDANGNRELGGGLNVVFKVGGSGAGQIGAVTDNKNGTYTATFTAGTVAGTETITAAIGGKTMISKATATVVPGPVSPSKATIRVSTSNPIQVGGTAVVTLTARDAYGNLETAGGSTVTFRLGSGSARGTFGPVVFQNGTYTATFTASVAGNNTIIGTIDGQSVASQTPTVIVVGGTANHSPSAMMLPSPIALGGETIPVTAPGVAVNSSPGNAAEDGGLIDAALRAWLLDDSTGRSRLDPLFEP